MKPIPVFLTLILLTACGRSAPAAPLPTVDAPPAPTESPAPAPFAVVGYFPDYRELNPVWAESLTDIIYFSAEPRADGSLDASRLNEETWQALIEQIGRAHV